MVTHSEELHHKQQRGFAQTLAKATRRLSELSARLERGKTRRPKPAVQREIDAICSARWVARCVSTTLTGTTPQTLRLEYSIDEAARQALADELFGKRILFTDHEQWTIAEIVGPIARSGRSKRTSAR